MSSYSLSWHKPSNRWLCRHTVMLLDDTKRLLATYGKTKAEASQKMDEKIANVKEKGMLKPQNLTVAEYLLFWIQKADGLRNAQRMKHLGNIRNHIIPYIGSTKLKRVDEDLIQQLVNTLYQEGRNPRTVEISRNILSRALREAAEHKMLYPVNMRNVKLRPYTPREKKIWTLEEAKRFLEVARDDEYYLLFILYLKFGLRRGEGIALRWEDVDFEHKIIHIRRQYTDVGKGFGIEELKTKNSKRDLPITPDLEAELLRLYKKPHEADKPIVSLDGKNYIKPNSVRWHLKKLIKQANLPYVDIHSMRHYVATMLKEASVSDVDIQKILGHASVKTTIECYQHSTINAKRQALLKTSTLL